MAVLTVNTVDRGNTAHDLVSLLVTAGASDAFPNTGRELFVVDNAAAGTCTVTFAVQATVDGQAVTNKTATVATGKIGLFGPFPTGTYNDTNSRTNISCTGNASVTVGVISPTAL